MTTTTMNAMNASMTGARTSRAAHRNNTSRTPSLAVTKSLQQRAALPEMPEQTSHASAFASVALRLVAAAVPVSGLAWLALVG